MALPSGSFSSQYAGTLLVTASAQFVVGGARNGSRWLLTGAGECIFLPYVIRAGVYTYGPELRLYGSETSEFLLSYPGGGVVWTVGIALVGYQHPTFVSSMPPGMAGIAIPPNRSIGANNMSVSAKLFKR